MAKFHLSKQEAEWFYDMMHMNLDESHNVVNRITMPYGVQLRTNKGQIINLYSTMKYFVQGKNAGSIKKRMEQLFGRFMRGREIDQKWYAFARDNNLSSEAFKIY